MSKKKNNEKEPQVYEDGSVEGEGGKAEYEIAAWRRSKNVRLAIIVGLLIAAGILFYFWEKGRLFVGGIIAVLLIALGLEVSNNDWDLGKAWEDKSFAEAKIPRDDDGNLMIGAICDDPDFDYNCNNFECQGEAQAVMDECGGRGNDVHGLDGNKDGVACQALPAC